MRKQTVALRTPRRWRFLSANSAVFASAIPEDEESDDEAAEGAEGEEKQEDAAAEPAGGGLLGLPSFGEQAA